MIQLGYKVFYTMMCTHLANKGLYFSIQVEREQPFIFYIHLSLGALRAMSSHRDKCHRGLFCKTIFLPLVYL